MTDERALSLRFRVEITGHDSLGDWTKCEGLTVEYDIHEYKEGGENEFVHRFPGRAKYTNVKLSRPMNRASADVATWVAKARQQSELKTGTIAVLDAAGKEVVKWALRDVFPARWTGPTLDVAGNQVAVEVLELAHSGFDVAKGTG